MHQATIKVIGQVQGVFYRAETKAQAQILGLTGFARNNANGSVTVVAQGSIAAIEKLITWCHQGPVMANVSHLKVEWQEPDDQYQTFEIR